MAWHSPDSTYQSFQNAKSTARVAGVPERVGTTICFPLADAAAHQLATLIYKCEQVTVDKVTTANRGVIGAGEKVRVHLSGSDNGSVEDDGGTLGANLIDCGFSLEAVVQTDTEVKIRFNGEAAELRA